MKSLNRVIFKVEEVKREMADTFNHQQPWRILYVGETLPFPESWTLWASGWQNSTATWLLRFNVSVNHWWPWRIFWMLEKLFIFQDWNSLHQWTQRTVEFQCYATFLWLYMYVSGKRWWPWRIFTVKLKQHKAITPYSSRACFNLDLQLHKTW